MDLLQDYETTISWLVSLCPEPDKFAHTYAGLAIWLVAALLLRRPLRSGWTLVPVIALELANETVDWLARGSWFWPDTARDLAATWFWPLVLFAALRLFPWLGGASARQPSAPAPQHDVERPGAAMAAMGAAHGDDVGRVIARGKPV